ncbi:MAG: TonB-dependent receptor [Proteobacteria bacterium]|nr:TonB-dependent receptor [Pseudomonadota bacterium]
MNWQVTPTALLYANVSKGYKSGAFPTVGATFAIQLHPATQESVLAYEAGFKLGLFNRTLQLNGAVFYYDYRDKQLRGRIVDPILGPQNAFFNVPRSRVAGAELQASMRPLNGLNINVGATYISSKILGSFINYNAAAQRVEMGGEAFPLTPDWQINGDADYEFPLSGSLNGFLGGGVTYQAATNGGLGNLALFKIDAYALVDLRAGIATPGGKWRLTAYVRNLTDKFYSTVVTQPGPDAVIRYTGQPRTFGLTLSYRY